MLVSLVHLALLGVNNINNPPVPSEDTSLPNFKDVRARVNFPCRCDLNNFYEYKKALTCLGWHEY